MSHVETEHAVPAWMLLAKVASSSPKLDYSKVIESWYTVSRYVCALGSPILQGRAGGKDERVSTTCPAIDTVLLRSTFFIQATTFCR